MEPYDLVNVQSPRMEQEACYDGQLNALVFASPLSVSANRAVGLVWRGRS
jgi:hypothetical protein